MSIKTINRLGIIAGSGHLPLLVAKACISNGGDVAIAKIVDANDNDYIGYDAVNFKIGKVSSIFSYFHSRSVKNVVMAGGISRPKFNELSLDIDGAYLVSRIIKSRLLGDDALLRVIANFIEENGFHVVSAIKYLDNVLLDSGVLTKAHPTESEICDIEYGFIEAKKIGSLDIGQSIVVKSGVVVGCEDINGTDALIMSCKDKCKSGILVKVIKPTQDERFDMPTIGIDTIKSLAYAGFSGIAIEAKKVIVINALDVIKVANEFGIFIVVI